MFSHQTRTPKEEIGLNMVNLFCSEMCFSFGYLRIRERTYEHMTTWKMIINIMNINQEAFFVLYILLYLADPLHHKPIVVF